MIRTSERARCMGTEWAAGNSTRSLPGMLALLLPCAIALATSVASAQTRFELLDTKRLSFDNARSLRSKTDFTLKLASVNFIDVDTDGDPDILVNTTIFLNDGLGNFSETKTPRFSAAFRSPLLALRGSPDIADFDGDGDMDLLYTFGAKIQSEPIRPYSYFLNDGKGFFTHVTDSHLPALAEATGFSGTAIGDVDGDGDLDIVTVAHFIAFHNNPPPRPHLLVNQGNGHFLEGFSRFPFANKDLIAVELADFDGDGDLDMVGAGEGNRLYLNDGNGFFVDDASTEIPQPFKIGGQVAVGDVDGDGDIDVIRDGLGINLMLYLNDGAAYFEDATLTHMPDTSRIAPIGFRLVDIDLDGDLDIVSGVSLFENINIDFIVFWNDGTGHFASPEFFGEPPEGAILVPPPSSLRYFAHGINLADTDGDGDLDIEVQMGLVNFPIGNKNWGPFIHRLYTNLHSQLELTVRVGEQPGSIQTEERPGPTSTKRLLAFDMYSQNPGRAFLLSDVSGSAAMQIPGLGGMLRLSPFTMQLVGKRLVAPGAPSQFVLPLDPVLVGTELFFQALFVDATGIRFSNLAHALLR